jgi:DnaK suppressor protein
MNTQQLAEFQRLLLEKKREIIEHAEKSYDDIKTVEKERAVDELDEATEAFNESMAIRFQDRERRLLSKVMKALEKIENGTFGICESCEEDISIERLWARPVTTKCVRCKEEEERQEKGFIKRQSSPRIF